MVTCSGNSTDKQPQNKDSLTKGHKTESRKTHERYNERKPVSISPIDEIMAPSQFKLWVLMPLVKQKTEIVTE
jgi:hypothetical protein|tara:strand:+ start:1088 stop:1306 length:219 start_codon:yes stop_codon:yes gene_type:complete